MALSHQATSTNTSTADRSSASFAHDSGSGSNRVLLVTTKTLTASGDISVSSITYNSVALTFIQGISREYTTARYLRVEQWYLVAPATGSNTLAVTYSGNARADEITVTTLNGGHQSDAVGAGNTAQGDSNNPSVTLTTETNNSWVMFGAHGRGGDLNPSAPGTGLTELTDGDTGASTSDDLSYTDGYKVTTTAGAYTVNSTFSASDQWVASAVEIKEAAADGAISGTSAGVGAASGAITGKGTLSGVATAVASLAATILAIGALAGAIAGTGAVSGQLTADGGMAGAIAGQTTVTAVLTADGTLVGNSAGVGAAMGALSSQAGLSGTSAGAATVSGALTADGQLIGASAGLATASGVLTNAGETAVSPALLIVRARSNALTLPERTNILTLARRDNTLLLPERTQQ